MAQLVEALHYELEGRRFNSEGLLDISHGFNYSSRTMFLKPAQPVTEMSTGYLS